jgi:hypothetical protein
LDRVALDQQQDAMTKQRGSVFCRFDFVILSGFVIASFITKGRPSLTPKAFGVD